jgi:hypothetical protein
MQPTLDELDRKHRTDTSSIGPDDLKVDAALLARVRRRR